MPDPNPEEILEFWFGVLDTPNDFPGDRSALWWGADPGVDREITERFGALARQARTGELDAWRETARGTLALVIVLDQFSRNIWRGTPEAFAGDTLAASVCQRAIESGLDSALRPIERAFLYMPLMHAEERSLARRCVACFEKLSSEIQQNYPTGYPDFLPHARQHAEIVERFGRYPHRNELLGRATTPEEQAFLGAGGPNFGQRRR